MKTYLCIENGEKFTVSAENLSEAQLSAAMYGGEVIGELHNVTPKTRPVKLLVSEIEKIWKDGTIEEQPQWAKDQIMNWLFGEEFMESEDKGSLKEYKE